MRISDWSSDVCSSDLNKLRTRHAADPLSAVRIGALNGYANEPTGEVPRHRHRIVGGGLVEQHRHVGLSAFTIETEGFDVGRCRGAHISHGRATLHRYNLPGRSEERREGTECVSTCRSRLSRYP